MALTAIGPGTAFAQTAAPSSVAPASPTIGTPAIIAATTPPPVGAPLAGANSYTEARTRQRMEDKGYSNIVDLKQDAQSIWRGTAMMGGKPMAVAIVFQGNVAGTAAPTCDLARPSLYN